MSKSRNLVGKSPLFILSMQYQSFKSQFLTSWAKTRRVTFNPIGKIETFGEIETLKLNKSFEFC